MLSLDPLWRRFLNYVHSKGGWRGKKIDWDPNDCATVDGFDERRRDDAVSAIEKLVARTKSRISEQLVCEEDEGGEDWEAAADKGWASYGD